VSTDDTRPCGAIPGRRGRFNAYEHSDELGAWGQRRDGESSEQYLRRLQFSCSLPMDHKDNLHQACGYVWSDPPEPLKVPDGTDLVKRNFLTLSSGLIESLHEAHVINLKMTAGIYVSPWEFEGLQRSVDELCSRCTSGDWAD
jgi:hypothetical protein